MKTYMLRFNERHGEPIVKAHSVNFLFLFDVIQIEDGVQTVLQKKFPILGEVTRLAITSFQLDESSKEKAALSYAVSCLKTEPNVQAVKDKKYTLRSPPIGEKPNMDYKTEFPIKWNNK